MLAELMNNRGEEQCASANIEIPNFKSKCRDFKNLIKKWVFLNIWCSYLYQPITKLMHRVGICNMSPSPMNNKYGEQNYWCHWCGMRGKKWIPDPEDIKFLNK